MPDELKSTNWADAVLSVLAVALVGSFVYECWVAGSLLWEHAHG